MTLTSSSRRRTAGFTALFAALLLVLSGVFFVSPADAGPDPDRRPCNKYGYEKFDRASGSETPSWGSMKWGSNAGNLDADTDTTELSYVIDPGYSVEFCIKAGNVDNTFSGAQAGSGYVSHPNPSISHVGYRVVGTPGPVTPEAPDFTDPDCDTTAAVILPRTTGVDYSYDSADVVPGGSVTVTATPKAGHHFPQDAKTTWKHDFPTISENCQQPTAVTPDAPTFTDPTCQVNSFGLDVPADTAIIDYTTRGAPGAGNTVTVTATFADGHVLADGADNEWKHTYGQLRTDCEEPTEVTPDAPTFTDPTCDNHAIGLEVPADTDTVAYTVTGEQEPDGTVTVTATATEGFVFPDGETTNQWVHTFGELPTNCGGVGGSEADPAASVTVDCDADNQIVLDNTGSDVVVTYTITGVDGYATVAVPAGEERVITDLGVEEGDSYDITVSADGMNGANASGTYDCPTPTTKPTPTPTPTPTLTPTPTPTTGVSPDVVEQPAPEPTPAQPAAQAATQDDLPATGFGSTALLLLALLMLGLGTAALRGSDPRRQN